MDQKLESLLVNLRLKSGDNISEQKVGGIVESSILEEGYNIDGMDESVSYEFKPSVFFLARVKIRKLYNSYSSKK
jgi:hypothetical protein